MDKEMYERLEGLHNIDEMKKFLDTFEFIVKDIQKEEPFHVDDIIIYLNFKMRNLAPLFPTSEL